MNAFLVTLGAVASLLTVIYVAIYVYANFKGNPKIFIRMQGEPIFESASVLGNEGIFFFALSTGHSGTVLLQSLDIRYDAAQGIDLYPLDDADDLKIELKPDSKLPVALTWHGSIEMRKKAQHAFAFRYKANKDAKDFTLRFEALGRIADWEWRFPLSLFSLQPRKLVREITPSIHKGGKLSELEQKKRFGLTLHPEESLTTHGSLAKLSASAISEKEGSRLRLYELLKIGR